MTEIERLRAQNAELLTILREIANIGSNASAAAMAQSALDTMQALERTRLEAAAIVAALR